MGGYNVSQKYHIVYKTINQKNGMWYIGRHSTDDLEDGYLGTGKYFLRALKDYGRENFTREILHIYAAAEESLVKEKDLVTQEVIDSDDSYNLIIGGKVGTLGYRWSEDHPCGGDMPHKHIYGADNPRYGMPPANKGICGRDNPRTMKYRLHFEDGRVKIVYWLAEWCKINGYRSITIRNLLFGRRGQYKDIVKVEYVLEEKTKHKRMCEGAALQ